MRFSDSSDKGQWLTSAHGAYGDRLLGTGQREATAIQASLRAACEKYGGEVQGEIAVEVPEDLDRVARRVRSSTKEVRVSVGRESPLDAAVGQIGDLKRLRAELRSAAEIAKLAEAELGSHVTEHGTSEDWEKTAAQASADLQRSQGALHILDAHTRIIEDAIAFLEAVPDLTECPVCGDSTEAKKLASRLHGSVKKEKAAEVRRLNASVKSARDTLDSVELLRKTRTHLVDAVTDASKGLNATRSSAWEALGKKSGKGDPLAEIDSREKSIDESLQGLRNANKDREGELQLLDDGADKIRTLQRFLKAESDAEKVRQRAAEGEGGGAKAFEEDKKKLGALRTDLDAIIKALNGLATGRAQGALSECGPDISRVYGQLCNHPYFDGLKIEVSQKAVSGVQRNTYRVVAFSSKEGEKTLASSRLSTAQMNCVALSAYLSLTKVLTHNLGFLLLDDPSQNLDTEHKRALAGVLKGLLPTTQLVIGTHDSEFDGLLRGALGREGVCWYDLAWAPRDGTTIKLEGGRSG